jgi:hypothetical protein
MYGPCACPANPPTRQPVSPLPAYAPCKEAKQPLSKLESAPQVRQSAPVPAHWQFESDELLTLYIVSVLPTFVQQSSTLLRPSLHRYSTRHNCALFDIELSPPRKHPPHVLCHTKEPTSTLRPSMTRRDSHDHVARNIAYRASTCCRSIHSNNNLR